jgi:cytochrome oxidase Cu insertion factor (SCO1/SenC/PrrC family)
MSENAPRSRASLWLIIGLCAAPVVASYLTFYIFTPKAQVNYGELVGTRPLPAATMQLTDGSPFGIERLRGKWVLLMADGGACSAACTKKLFTMRQLRLAQGREMSRIERVWLISDGATLAGGTVAPFAGTWLVRAAGSDLLKALPADNGIESYLYLADPLGNLVLRYSLDADPTRVIKDITRLLKTSGIG